jgi:hypothetical protein
MIWLVLNNESHQIISCNIFNGDNIHQLWVTRPNGKNLKVVESNKEEAIREIKDAIDFAIEQGFTTVSI